MNFDPSYDTEKCNNMVTCFSWIPLSVVCQYEKVEWFRTK